MAGTVSFNKAAPPVAPHEAQGAAIPDASRCCCPSYMLMACQACLLLLARPTYGDTVVQEIAVFDDPKVDLEQYPTGPHLASRLLFTVCEITAGF